MNSRVALLAVLAAIGLTTFALAQNRSAPPNRPTPPFGHGWEYARLTIVANIATLETERAIFRIESPQFPPTDDPTVFANAIGTFEKRFNPLFHVLNLLGSAGWELNPETDLHEGQTYFIRRAR